MSDEVVSIELPADLAYKAKGVMERDGRTASTERHGARKREWIGASLSAVDGYVAAALLELPERPRPIQVGDRVRTENTALGFGARVLFIDAAGRLGPRAFYRWDDGAYGHAYLSDLSLLPEEEK